METFVDTATFKCESYLFYYLIRCDFEKYKIQSVELETVDNWEYTVQVNGATIFKENVEFLSEAVYNKTFLPDKIFLKEENVRLRIENTWSENRPVSDMVNFKIVLEKVE